MPNPALEKRLDAIQKSLMAVHAGGAAIPANARGSEREGFVDKFLSKVLPPVYRFGTGGVTDSKGSESGQLDIVIELPFGPSFPMPGDDRVRLYLADSVMAVIEVKSDLTSQWDEVRATTQKIKRLARELHTTIGFGEAPTPQIPVFSVGYTGHSTLEGLQKRLDTTPIDERPDSVFVIDSGVTVSKIGTCAQGPWGLYLLIGELMVLTRQTVAAVPSWDAYLK